ncbi:MAG: hypothetical protein WAM52_05985 [Steroidobacteraceae bacterium]
MTDNEKEKERSSTQLAPFAIKEFLENQKRELEVRAGEVQLKSQEDVHAFEHAGRVLQAQERDRRDDRQFKLKSAKHRYWFIGALVILSLGFLWALAFMGKDQMAIEIFKAAVYLSAGATAGFFYGNGKSAHGSQIGRESAENDEDE